MTEAETAEAIALCQKIERSIDRIEVHIAEIKVIFDRIELHMPPFKPTQDARA